MIPLGAKVVSQALTRSWGVSRTDTGLSHPQGTQRVTERQSCRFSLTLSTQDTQSPRTSLPSPLNRSVSGSRVPGKVVAVAVLAGTTPWQRCSLATGCCPLNMGATRHCEARNAFFHLGICKRKAPCAFVAKFYKLAVQLYQQVFFLAVQ